MAPSLAADLGMQLFLSLPIFVPASNSGFGFAHRSFMEVAAAYYAVHHPEVAATIRERSVLWPEVALLLDELSSVQM